MHLMAKMTELEKATRALAKRVAEREALKEQAAGTKTPTGCQHPLRWELEQADVKVWEAERRARRAQVKEAIAHDARVAREEA